MNNLDIFYLIYLDIWKPYSYLVIPIVTIGPFHLHSISCKLMFCFVPSNYSMFFRCLHVYVLIMKTCSTKDVSLAVSCTCRKKLG